MPRSSGKSEVESGLTPHSPLNAWYFWPILITIVAIDVVTKAIAVDELIPARVPHELIGNWLRFTLVYNPGAAFGLHVGEYSRWVFTALTIGALLILGRLYITAPRGDRARVSALALVCGGAIGNLIDRLRPRSLGVVDFIDIGFGDARWPTFNVADIAVSMGAFLLAIVLWSEERPEEQKAGIVAEMRPESTEAT
jgi:signal peptidase II